MKTKFNLINLHLFELDTLAEYFEVMASKGYMLTGLYLGRIRFKKCTPQKVHFHLNIYQKGSYMNPKLISDEEVDYCDFICEYGYEPVCTYSNFQVFKSVEENMIPIETIVHEEFTKAQYKTIIKYELFNHVMLTMMFTLLGSLQIYALQNLSLYMLSSNIAILTPIFWLFLIILSWWRTLPFLKWLVQKERYHISYEKLLRRERRMNIFWAFIIILLLVTILNSNFNAKLLLPMAMFFLVAGLSYMIIEAVVSRFLKKYATIIATVLAGIISMAVLINMGINAIFTSSSTSNSSQDISTVSFRSFIPDLPKATSVYSADNESFLLKEVMYSEEYPISYVTEEGYIIPTTNYTYSQYTINMPYFKDFITNKILYEYETPQYQSMMDGWQWYQSDRMHYLIKDNYIFTVSDFEVDDNQTQELLSLFIEAFHLNYKTN